MDRSTGRMDGGRAPYSVRRGTTFPTTSVLLAASPGLTAAATEEDTAHVPVLYFKQNVSHPSGEAVYCYLASGWLPSTGVSLR
jgi:hypothetical protein